MSMIVVAAALIDANDAVLIQQRPSGKHLAGHWEFPGGKVDPRESTDAALARELAEELGISVDPASLEPFSFVNEPRQGGDMLLLLYLCHAWQGTATPLEANAIEWLEPRQLLDWDLAPADQVLARRLMDHVARLGTKSSRLG